MNFGEDLNKEILYLSEHPDQFSKGKVKKIISRFVESAKPQDDIIESEFTGKKVCFSTLYCCLDLRDCNVRSSRQSAD